MPRKLPNTEIVKAVIADYLSETMYNKDIITKYSIVGDIFYMILKESNIPLRPYLRQHRRKYFFNESYFEEIDTQEKAYFLGLLAADGCITARKTQTKVSIGLTDRELIEKLKEAVGTDAPISERKPKDGNIQYRLGLYSKKMVSDVAKWGLIPNKYSRTKIPNIDNTLIPHFIRGYFDGDGNCYVGFESFHFSITSSSIQILEQIDKFCINEGIIKNQNHIYSRKTHPSYKTFTVGGKKDFINFGNFMYKDATIFLNRKYEYFAKGKIEALKPRQKRKNCSSSYIGVSFSKNKVQNPWFAYIQEKKKFRSLGYHASPELAARAYNSAIAEMNLDRDLNIIPSEKLEN